MLKKGIRILALNGAPFRRGEERELVIGIVGRGSLIEGSISFNVDIDGTDSTEMLIKSFKASKFRDQIKIIAINGITLGGLNILDFEKISNELGVGVIGITRNKPRRSLLKKSLVRDPKRKLKAEMIDRLYKKIAVVRRKGFYIQFFHIEDEDLMQISDEAFQLLRVAHLLASGIKQGESRGRI